MTDHAQNIEAARQAARTPEPGQLTDDCKLCDLTSPEGATHASQILTRCPHCGQFQ